MYIVLSEPDLPVNRMAESGHTTPEEEKERDVLTGAGLDRKCSLPVLSTSSHGKARRSSLVTVKTGLRKTSFVSFEEKNTTIEIDEPVDAGDEESTENEDILAALREQNCDEEGKICFEGSLFLAKKNYASSDTSCVVIVVFS